MRKTYTGKLIQSNYWGIPKVELHTDKKEIILTEAIFDEFLDKEVIITINDEGQKSYTAKEIAACLNND